jgi:hypothetical protein
MFSEVETLEIWIQELLHATVFDKNFTMQMPGKRGAIAPTYSCLQYWIGLCGQRQALAMLYPKEMSSGTHWIGGWVGLRAGLDTDTRG